MKKLSWIMAFMLSFIFIIPLYADEVDDSLPTQASEQLRASTREIIQAGMNKDDAINMTRSMIQNRFSERNILKAQKIIKNAYKENLPVEPVMNKAFEGMSKKIHEKKILNAMEKTRSRYAYAYEHVRKLSDDEAQIEKTGKVLAQGMAAGLAKEDADAIMTKLRDRTRLLDRQQSDDLCEKTLLLTRDMMRLGTSSTDAALMVGNALQNRFSAQEMGKMMNTFMHQSRFQSPNDLANQYANQIQNGVGAEAIGDKGSMSKSDVGNQADKPDSAATTGNADTDIGSSDSGSSGSSDPEGSDDSGDSPGPGSSGDSGSEGSGSSSGSGKK